MYCDVYDEVYNMPYPRVIVLKKKEKDSSTLYYIFYKRFNYCYCSLTPIDFSNGPSMIKLCQRKSKYIFIDKNLKNINNEIFDYAEPFNELGYTYVGKDSFNKTFYNIIGTDGNYLYVDSNKQPIWCSDFVEHGNTSMNVIEVPNKGWTFINSKGKHICINKNTGNAKYFDDADPQRTNGTAVKTKDGNIYLIDYQLVIYKNDDLDNPIDPKDLDFKFIK